MMNRPLTIALMLLLSGCHAKTVLDAPPPEPMVVIERPARHFVPLPVPPVPPDTVAALTPTEIIVASDQARTDATGYVAWSASKPENIDRLTTLTASLNVAVAQMRAGRMHGKYAPTDVIAARAALKELRSFLATKGD